MPLPKATEHTHCTTRHPEAWLSKVFKLEDWRDSSVVRSTGYCSRGFGFNSPTPTRWLTTFCNSSSRESNSIFWPLSVSGTHVVHIHRCRQKRKINKPLRSSTLYPSPNRRISQTCSTPTPENPSDPQSTEPWVSAHPRAQRGSHSQRCPPSPACNSGPGVSVQSTPALRVLRKEDQ